MISVAIQFSALAVLVCLFGPRVFIMIAWPSQNVMTATTSPSASKGQQQTSSNTRELPPSFLVQQSSGVSTDNDESNT